MRIRTLVPALACLAAASIATAADTAPAVKFDGFVDVAWSLSAQEKGGATTGFGSNTPLAKLGVAATISEKISTQIDILVKNDATVSANQAYGTWKITSDIELKTGLFIADYGWTSAYAPGLYRVNGGVIGSLYGGNSVGVNAKYTTGPITAAVTLENGFFAEGVGSSTQNPGQANEAYALGLDVIYSLGDKGSVNVEAVYDENAGPSTADTTNGDGYYLGANATLTMIKDLTVGAELVYQGLNQKAGTKDSAHTGAMVLANYKLAAAIPASVTGQLSCLDIDQAGATSFGGVPVTKGDSMTLTEVAVALLTNPAGTDKFGLNFELNYKTYTITPAGGKADSTYAYGAAAEFLYVF